MPWPPALPVMVAPGRTEEEDAAAAGEESDWAAEPVEAEVDDVEPVLAVLVLDERDAQPASVAPMAIIEIRTEILMFL